MRKILLCGLAIMTLLQACKKDPAFKKSISGESDTTLLSKSQVKQWFALQQTADSDLLTDGLSSGDHRRLPVVNWDNAQAFPNHSGHYWIAGLNGIPKAGKYLSGYRKIVFFKDTDKKITARILEIIPDGLYLQLKKRTTTADFTGRLFIFDLNYRLLGGRVYSGGKIIGGIKPKKEADAPDKLHTDYVAPVESCDWVDSNYIDADGGVVIYSEQFCSFSAMGGGAGGFDGGSGDYLSDSHGGGGGSGGSSSTTTVPPPPVSNLPGEAGPAVDPKALMTCFGSIPDAGAKMTVTVYVVEPFPGTSFNIGPNSVGHTAIGLTKTNGTQSITQVLGFYPDASGIDKLHAPSKIVINDNIDYNVSISYEVSGDSFKRITNYIATPPLVYDLVSFNCTDFVDNACLQGGIELPNPYNSLGMDVTGHPLYQGMSPAGLGQSIEKLKGQTNVNANGGITPISKGPCN